MPEFVPPTFKFVLQPQVKLRLRLQYYRKWWKRWRQKSG